ncbi:DUF4178 domain-containing protein [Rudanella paleaurantiibacter]|uniref:DUF4178 domain-containing protein n=1 Tax=Rudanella paleaurantiibacter TaxID=2614655 RepID=A0A7J5U443_9BACT|nr:DUF4178 domain-containing protein [Rudanella paleaurantiibacter]KAB7732614.1 DUF4178 domain-containing protein [Rudanella paleaurantiibacter]
MTDALPSDSQPASATLQCPHCGHTITYYDVTGSSFYGCPNCQTFFKYETESLPRRLTQFDNQTKPVLPVGTEGFIEGQFHRVVGYMHRKERGKPYNWVEYILFRADGVYTQLAEYEGHWTYIVPTKAKYKEYGKGGNAYYVDTEERQYRLYNRYDPQTLLAIGEFDWNVLDDDRMRVSEYINPPYTLVAEVSSTRTDWYKGIYKTRQEVANAFGLSPSDLPKPQGTGAAQPAISPEKWQGVLSFTGMALVILFGLQLLLAVVKPRQFVLDTTYSTELDTGATNVSNGLFKPVISPSFTIKGPAALEIRVSADIDNQWVELPMSLVNEQTGQSYEFTKVLEYYHGVDGGESWSEGGAVDEAELSRIPSGRYHLNLYPISQGKTSVRGSLRVTQNPTIFGNLMILLTLLLIYPIYLLFKKQILESNRWQNSDFADEGTE